MEQSNSFEFFTLLFSVFFSLSFYSFLMLIICIDACHVLHVDAHCLLGGECVVNVLPLSVMLKLFHTLNFPFHLEK